ncbi:TIGR00282 family metallophosphoesterase [Formicincola oecophyllae]|uniref:TIGR00282 family metallophosphoesterase n=1 Tax=Formicincola oecophyllae TaxID=2558361 RepID=A0A4Y6U9C5_9PROT|nr:TIGR00282 family metallophosphoesterase [Formicincola oecophyllae]QDH13056.1 TIGR00282 family metallophosphoesterase [Formicincola oecophyllae]
MKILFLGDIVGRSGRDAVCQNMKRWRQELQLDLVVANGENAAHGFGLTRAIATELFQSGVDVVTLGNHAWDQSEMVSAIGAFPHLIRPLNYPPGTPGHGAVVVEVKPGCKALVLNLMGRIFMDPLDDPFRAVAELLSKHRLGTTVQAIVVDIHAEATSEKMGLATLLDGHVSLVVGTHTHVPTADWRILPGGTAYQTDAGMCGAYDSIIGMDKTIALERFTNKVKRTRHQPAPGPATVCGLYVEVDDRTGRATQVAPFRQGGFLSQAWPASNV